ncbi:MAG: cbb3-type cytochrome c oxidase subunit I [Gemmatimonadaceae bacterium]
MHSIARRYIKTAIAFLMLGLVLGVRMLANRELNNRFATPFEMSAHTHALLVGFVMQMIMGVALWMFPRPAKDDTRYRPFLMELAYWVMTLSTVIRVAGELARNSVSDPWLRWLIVMAGIGQAIAVLLFFQNMWPRIRPVGSRAREESGEKF